MAVAFYDKLPLNEDIVLDWSLTEGLGALVHDVSKSGSIGTLIGDIAVGYPAQIGHGYYGVFLFNAWHQYINCPAADCPNLNFQAGDYSLSCWLNWSIVESSQILMGKYVLDVSGWECYLTNAAGVDYITVRHHHAGGATARTASYSTGWSVSTLHLFGYSRSGGVVQHYRNGQPITTVVGVLLDPESNAANDLRCGTRYTEDANWLNGYLGRPRAWSRALTDVDHRQLFAQGNAQ